MRTSRITPEPIEAASASCEDMPQPYEFGGHKVLYFVHSKGGAYHVSNVVHGIFRLLEEGELLWIATFADALRAEQLVETLDWQWPGEYVIRHLLVGGEEHSGVPPVIC